MIRSCLGLIVIVALGIFGYRMYKKTQEPVSTEIQTEYGSDFQTNVLIAIDPLVAQNGNIQRVNLDGSVLDLQYSRNQSSDRFRQDASAIAEVFSRKKAELTEDGDVTVRCIYDNLIRVEVSASNGRVMGIQEL